MIKLHVLMLTPVVRTCYTYIHTYMQTERRTDGQTDKHNDRQIDRQTDRQVRVGHVKVENVRYGPEPTERASTIVNMIPEAPFLYSYYNRTPKPYVFPNP